MRATSGRRLHEFPTQFSGAGRTVRSHLRISETIANSSASAPTSNVGRVLAAKRLRLAAFSVAHVAPLRGLPAALRRLLFALQNLANITGRSTSGVCCEASPCVQARLGRPRSRTVHER